MRRCVPHSLATGLALERRRASIEGRKAMTETIEQRLGARGIVLPQPASPVGTYVPYTRLGNLVFLSGQGPRRPDGTFATGKVGKDVTVEEAYQHARLVGLALL